MTENLPQLTYKQQKFITKYIQNGNKASDAYRFAYNCRTMSAPAINTEASKLLKNPKITLWIDYYRKNVQNFIDKEIIYTTEDAFQEFEDLQEVSMLSPKTYNIALKAIENKCKLKGHYKDNIVSLNGTVVQMGSVEVDGRELTLKIGESANDVETPENT